MMTLIVSAEVATFFVLITHNIMVIFHSKRMKQTALKQPNVEPCKGLFAFCFAFVDVL